MADAGDYRCQASNIYQNKLLYLSVSRMWVMADAGDYRCQASNIHQNKLLYLSVSRMW